jgi:outer membrane immunogenic protein
LQYYRIHTATFSQEAARAIRELREDGCPRGTGTSAATPVPSGRGGGFYIGVNTGYGWGSNEIVDPSGGSVGVQGGYGVELGSGFFVGVEAGFKYGGVSGSTAEFGITEELRQNWTVSFLGRVGVAAPAAGGPLIYVTVGPTLANTEFSVSGPGFRDVDKQVLSGLTGGIGAEIAVTPNVSVGAQYLHTRYRSGKFFDGTIEIGPTRTNTFNLIGNYRFGVVGQ